ncbi:MAG TPA: hypothetical protein VFL66_10640 [Gaiellaceae bacterium]|nr:hypothetical protein [Gaiellaceae bacterium]
MRPAPRVNKISAGNATTANNVNEAMNKRTDATCNDCYFRRAGLCALSLETPCPTFRLATRGSLAPPRQARLVPRPAAFPQPAAA